MVEVTAGEEGDQRRLRDVLRENSDIDLWGSQRRRGIFQVTLNQQYCTRGNLYSNYIGHDLQMMVPRGRESVLKDKGFEFKERIRDVRVRWTRSFSFQPLLSISPMQALLQKDRQLTQTALINRKGGSSIRTKGIQELGEFYKLEDVNDYIKYLSDKYNHVWLESIGKSYEGNDMKVVKICYHNCRKNRIIFIEAGKIVLLLLVAMFPLLMLLPLLLLFMFFLLLLLFSLLLLLFMFLILVLLSLLLFMFTLLFLLLLLLLMFLLLLLFLF